MSTQALLANTETRHTSTRLAHPSSSSEISHSLEQKAVQELLFAPRATFSLEFGFAGKKVRCVIGVRDFFEQLQKRLESQGISIKEIYLKGSAARSALVPCAIHDLDFDLLLCAPSGKLQDWQRIYRQEFLALLEKLSKVECKEDEKGFHFLYNGMKKSVSKEKFAAKPSLFDMDKEGLKALGKYGERVLVSIHATPYNLDFNGMVEWPENRCTSSADCFVIRATNLLNSSIPVQMETVDGYDKETSLELYRQNRFSIDRGKAKTLTQGVCYYLKNLTNGLIPDDFDIQEELTHKLYQDCITTDTGTINDKALNYGIRALKYRLKNYLEEKYSQEVDCKLVFLMNFEEILLQIPIRDKEKFLAMVYDLAFSYFDFPSIEVEKKEQLFSYLKVVYYLSTDKRVYPGRHKIYQCFVPKEYGYKKYTYVGRKIAAALFKIPQAQQPLLNDWKEKIKQIFPFLEPQRIPRKIFSFSHLESDLEKLANNAWQLIDERCPKGFANFLAQVETSLARPCWALRQIKLEGEVSYHDVYFALLQDCSYEARFQKECFSLCLKKLITLSNPLDIAASKQCLEVFLHEKEFIEAMKALSEPSRAFIIKRIQNFFSEKSDEIVIVKLHFSQAFSSDDWALFLEKREQLFEGGDENLYKSLLALNIEKHLPAATQKKERLQEKCVIKEQVDPCSQAPAAMQKKEQKLYTLDEFKALPKKKALQVFQDTTGDLRSKFAAYLACRCLFIWNCEEEFDQYLRQVQNTADIKNLVQFCQAVMRKPLSWQQKFWKEYLRLENQALPYQVELDYKELIKELTWQDLAKVIPASSQHFTSILQIIHTLQIRLYGRANFAVEGVTFEDIFPKPVETWAILQDRSHPEREQLYWETVDILEASQTNEEEFIHRYQALEDVSSSGEKLALDGIFQKYIRSYPERFLHSSSQLLCFIENRRLSQSAKQVLEKAYNNLSTEEMLALYPTNSELFSVWEKVFIERDLSCIVDKQALKNIAFDTQNAILQEKIEAQLLKLATVLDLAWLETLPKRSSVEEKLIDLESSITWPFLEHYLRVISAHCNLGQRQKIAYSLLERFPSVRTYIIDHKIPLDEPRKKSLGAHLLGSNQLDYIDLFGPLPQEGRCRLPESLVKAITANSEKLEEVLIKHLKETPKGQRVYTASAIDALACVFAPKRKCHFSTIAQLDQLSKPQIWIESIKLVKNLPLIKKLLATACKNEEAEIIAFGWEIYEQTQDKDIALLLAKYRVPKAKTLLMEKAIQELSIESIALLALNLKDKTSIANKIEKENCALPYLPIFIGIIKQIQRPRAQKLAAIFIENILGASVNTAHFEELLDTVDSNYLQKLSKDPRITRPQDRFQIVKRLDSKIWQERGQTLCSGLDMTDKEVEFLFYLLEQKKIFGFTETYLLNHANKLSGSNIIKAYKKACGAKQTKLEQALGEILFAWCLHPKRKGKSLELTLALQTLADQHFHYKEKNAEQCKKLLEISAGAFQGAEVKESLCNWLQTAVLQEVGEAIDYYIDTISRLPEKILLQKVTHMLDEYTSSTQEIRKQALYLARAFALRAKLRSLDPNSVKAIFVKLLSIADTIKIYGSIDNKRVQDFSELIHEMSVFCLHNIERQKVNASEIIEWVQHIYRLDEALYETNQTGLAPEVFQRLASLSLGFAVNDTVVVLQAILQTLQTVHVQTPLSFSHRLQIFAKLQEHFLRLEKIQAPCTVDYHKILVQLNDIWTEWITTDTPLEEDKILLATIIMNQCQVMQSHHNRLITLAEHNREIYVSRLWMRESFFDTITYIFQSQALSEDQLSTVADALLPLLLELGNNNFETANIYNHVFRVYLEARQGVAGSAFFSIVRKATNYNQAFNKQEGDELSRFYLSYIKELFSCCSDKFSVMHLCLSIIGGQIQLFRRGIRKVEKTDIENYTILSDQLLVAIKSFFSLHSYFPYITQEKTQNTPYRQIFLRKRMDPVIALDADKSYEALRKLQDMAINAEKSFRFAKATNLEILANCNGEFFDLVYFIEQMFAIASTRDSAVYMASFLRLAAYLSEIQGLDQAWLSDFKNRLQDHLLQRFGKILRSARISEILAFYDAFQFLADKNLFDSTWVVTIWQRLSILKGKAIGQAENILKNEKPDHQILQNMANELELCQGSDSAWAKSYIERVQKMLQVSKL